MKCFLSSSVAILASLCAAAATNASTILIGDGVNNGFFSDTSNPTSATGDTITTNASGRAFIDTSSTNDSIEIDSRSAVRKFYNGGNAAFGWDASSGAGPGGARSVGDAPYAFINAGNVEYTADAVAGAFSVGDAFNLSFGAFTVNARTDHEVLATLTFDSGEVFSDTLQAGDNENDSAFFNEDYVLTQAATSVTLTLLMQSDLTDSDGDNRRAGQFTIDNVQLTHTPIPEPTSALLALMGLSTVGSTGMRRRLR